MPSQLHEALLLLIRNRSQLAPRLLRDGLHVVLHLLTLKFRKVSAATKRRVAHASVHELDRCAERILTATTLRDVFKED